MRLRWPWLVLPSSDGWRESWFEVWSNPDRTGDEGLDNCRYVQVEICLVHTLISSKTCHGRSSTQNTYSVDLIISDLLGCCPNDTICWDGYCSIQINAAIMVSVIQKRAWIATLPQYLEDKNFGFGSAMINEFISTRRTKELRDSILALMLQYECYQVPPNVNSISFSESFFDRYNKSINLITTISNTMLLWQRLKRFYNDQHGIGLIWTFLTMNGLGFREMSLYRVLSMAPRLLRFNNFEF